MSDLISKQETIHEIMGEHPDAHYPSWYADIVEKIQPVEAIPVSWIEARIKRFITMDNAFGGLTANIMLVMLNEWKREQEVDNETGRIHGSGI